jgi:transcriptional regulator with XRE-family HTH domain
MNYLSQQSWFAVTRVRLGITQQQLANSLGISRSQLAMAETGKRKLSQSALAYLEKMQAIAKQLPIPEPVTRRRVTGFVPLKEYNRIAPKVTRNPHQAVAITPCKYSIEDVPGLVAYQQQQRCRLQYLQLEKKNAAISSILFAAQLKGFDMRISCRQEFIEKYPTHPLNRKWLGQQLLLACRKAVLKRKSSNCDAGAMRKRDRVIRSLKSELKWLDGIMEQVQDAVISMETQWLFGSRLNAA